MRDGVMHYLSFDGREHRYRIDAGGYVEIANVDFTRSQLWFEVNPPRDIGRIIAHAVWDAVDKNGGVAPDSIHFAVYPIGDGGGVWS